MKKTKTVYKESIFPANINIVFKLLQDFETLQYVAKPYASFEPLNHEENIKWCPGQKLAFKFKLCCFIPFGIHTINVIDFDKENIYTNESNTHVPVWNHRIKLIENNDGITTYSDEVEIGAGWKTLFVWIWANWFYVHR